LTRLRQLDPIAPVIAVSGVATPEVAAELVQAGADDYISKENLSRKVLAHSVRSALARADAFLGQDAAQRPRQATRVDDLLRRICQDFVAGTGPEFLDRLEELEAAARQVTLTVGQAQQLFEAVCGELDAARPADRPPVKQLLRPVLLEVLLRIFGNGTADEPCVHRHGAAH
jgi:DNA-binding response OmpR family regulator